MSRLGLLPEQAFAEDFKQLRRDIEEIKRAQRVGRDILKPKIVEAKNPDGTPTLYDVVATYDAVTDSVRAFFTARFIADTQEEPWATPIIKLMFGDPNTPAAPGQTYGFSYPYLDDFRTTKKKMSYHGYFGNNLFPGTQPVYLKIYFYATDTGTLTVTNENTL